MVLLEMDEALKLNEEYRIIDFERFNHIAKKCRSYRPDWGKLEDQLKVTNQTA